MRTGYQLGAGSSKWLASLRNGLRDLCMTGSSPATSTHNKTLWGPGGAKRFLARTPNAVSGGSHPLKEQTGDSPDSDFGAALLLSAN